MVWRREPPQGLLWSVRTNNFRLEQDLRGDDKDVDIPKGKYEMSAFYCD